MQKRAQGMIVGAMAVLGAAGAAHAQVPGPRVAQYPDIIVSSVGGSYDSTGSGALQMYGSANGWGSYAIGSDSCNIGLAPGIWIDGGTATTANQHPVIGGQVYRLFNGRFEQVGMSWLKHGFCAADSCSSGPSSGGQQGCLNIGGLPPNNPPPAQQITGCRTDWQGSPALAGTGTGCDWLGFGRATDTYGSGLNGSQGYLGPRSEVNPWSGVYPYPYVRQGSNTSCLNKRLLVRHTDLDPANYPRYNASTTPWGARYFGEVVYIMTDEWPTERYNGYSYRPISVTTTQSATGSCGGSLYGMDFSGLTVPMKPAIEAWKVADPTVVIVKVDAPNDGRFYIGAKTTSLGGGRWQYEYAVFNMNSNRAAGSFMIPKSPYPSVVIEGSSLGFHAPEYHSGEPFSMKPWQATVAGSNVTWACDPYSVNANANAIRWSTLYNFRFVSNQAPKNDPAASIRLGLFKPGVQLNDADFIDVSGLPVPGAPPCPVDFDHVNGVNVTDIFAFLTAWFAGDTAADFNHVNGLNVTDITDFLAAWFLGC